MSVETEYAVKVHHADEGATWAEVLDLPGCFASGDSMEELSEALGEAICLYVGDDPGGGTRLRVDEMRVRVLL